MSCGSARWTATLKQDAEQFALLSNGVIARFMRATHFVSRSKNWVARMKRAMTTQSKNF
jgi:hypothetical protein